MNIERDSNKSPAINVNMKQLYCEQLLNDLHNNMSNYDTFVLKQGVQFQILY